MEKFLETKTNDFQMWSYNFGQIKYTPVECLTCARTLTHWGVERCEMCCCVVLNCSQLDLCQLKQKILKNHQNVFKSMDNRNHTCGISLLFVCHIFKYGWIQCILKNITWNEIVWYTLLLVDWWPKSVNATLPFFLVLCLVQVLKVTVGILEYLDSQVTLEWWACMDLLGHQG